MLSTHSLPGQHQGKQYSPFLLSEAANYEVEMLTELGSAGSAGEGVLAVIDAFSTLEDHEKFVFISAVEIYV